MPPAASAAPACPAPLAPARDLDAETRRLVQDGRLSRREVAERLGPSERTFYRRLKALGLS